MRIYVDKYTVGNRQTPHRLMRNAVIVDMQILFLPIALFTWPFPPITTL